MDKVTEAKCFASYHHRNQKYGNGPYTKHLEVVEATLEDFGMVKPFDIQRAWLHDILEDTKVTFEDLEHEFGVDLANHVWAMTGVGKNRKARNECIFKRLNLYPEAICIKLADRIANTKNCMIAASFGEKDLDLYHMYKKEYPAFKAALKPLSKDYDDMWEELDLLFESKVHDH